MLIHITVPILQFFQNSHIKISRGSVDQEMANRSIFINIGFDVYKSALLGKIQSMRDLILDSDDCVWVRNHGNYGGKHQCKCQNRYPDYKRIMLDKIDVLIALVIQDRFSEAYNKLLHDIKPKLTGAKTNENEVPCGNGKYAHPWIKEPALQQYILPICNAILKGLLELATIS
jgi:hypothetical protein